MEEWQILAIRKNFPRLMMDLEVDVKLLSFFQSKRMLMREEVAIIHEARKQGGRFLAALKFLDIIHVRKNACNVLEEALVSLSQYELAKMLANCRSEYEKGIFVDINKFKESNLAALELETPNNTSISYTNSPQCNLQQALLEYMIEFIELHPVLLGELYARNIVSLGELRDQVSVIEAKRTDLKYLLRKLSMKPNRCDNFVELLQKYCQNDASMVFKYAINENQLSEEKSISYSVPVHEIRRFRRLLKYVIHNEYIGLTTETDQDELMYKLKINGYFCDVDIEIIGFQKLKNGMLGQTEKLFWLMRARVASNEHFIKLLKEFGQNRASDIFAKYQALEFASIDDLTFNSWNEECFVKHLEKLYCPTGRFSVGHTLVQNGHLSWSEAATNEILALENYNYVRPDFIQFFSTRKIEDRIILDALSNADGVHSSWLQKAIRENLLYFLETKQVDELCSQFMAHGVLHQQHIDILKERKKTHGNYAQGAVLFGLLSARCSIYEQIETSLLSCGQGIMVEILRLARDGVGVDKKRICANIKNEQPYLFDERVREQIQNSLPQLMNGTKITPLFLSTMYSYDVISCGEYFQFLFAKENGFTQVKRFYEIIGTRCAPIDIFISALRDDNQADACGMFEKFRTECLTEVNSRTESKKLNRSKVVNLGKYGKILEKNMSHLISVTTANKTLLKNLSCRRILSRCDIDLIETEGNLNGEDSKTAKLYDILHGRLGKFIEIEESLMECNQVEAAEILRNRRLYLENGTGMQEFTGIVTRAKLETKLRKFKSGIPRLLQAIANPNYDSILIITPDVNLTMSKIIETIPKSAEIKTLKSLKEFSRIKLPTHSYLKKLLLVHIDKEVQITKRDTVDLNRLKQEYSNVLLVLTKEELADPKHQGIIQAGKYHTLNDSFDWSDLSEKYQDSVLTQEVVDQGHCRQLAEVCKTFAYDDDRLFLARFLKDQLLLDLLNQKKPIIFRQTIPLVANYIGRKLISRNIISRNIFQTKSGDAIVISCDHTESLPLDFSVKHIIRSNTDFDKICQEEKKNVHWLHWEQGKLKWMKSRAQNIKTILKNILQDQLSKPVSEEQAYLDIEQINQPVIICDSPGMGKTALMSNLAKIVRKNTENSLVLYFVAKDFVNAVISRFSDKDLYDMEVMEQMITDEINSNAYGRSTSEVCVKTTHLFFDGVDEVPEGSLDYCITYLKQIVQMYKSSGRVYVSTRKHLLSLLESSFQTIGYNIEPFDENDQVRFLRDFWLQNETSQNDKEVIELYANACLKALHASDEQSIQKLAGIPLQCHLIAEVYQEEALGFLSDFKANPNVHVEPTVSMGSPAELYSALIDRKLLKYKQDHLKLSQYTIAHMAMKKIHLYLSVKEILATELVNDLTPLILTTEVYDLLELFVDKWNVSLEDFQNGRQLPRKEILKVGIMETKDSDSESIQFLHRTFAEFLVASFIVELLNGVHSSQYLTDCVFQKVLATTAECVLVSAYKQLHVHGHAFKYSQVLHFVNAILSQEADPIFPVREISQKSVIRIVMACVRGNHEHTLNRILNMLGHIDKHLLLSAVLLAARHSSVNIFQNLFARLEPTDLTSLPIFYIAVERGDIDILGAIISNPGFHLLSENWSSQQGIIHTCISETVSCSNHVLAGKTRILAEIEELNPQVLSEKDELGRLPFLQPGVHVELYKLLFKLPIDKNHLDETDNNRQTILHHAAANLCPANFAILISEIRKNHSDLLPILLKSGDRFGRTPLHILISNSEISKESFGKMLVGLESSKHDLLNAEDDNYYSILWTALKSRKNIALINDLISFGANVNYVDNLGRNALHIASLHASDPEVIKFLIGKGLSVNCRDAFDNTAIYYAIRNPSQSKDISILDALIHLKADISNQNKKGETAFHIAAKCGNVKVMKRLCALQFHKNINCSEIMDKHENTIMHHALNGYGGDKLEMTKFLLSLRHSDVFSKNKKGQSPLDYSLSTKYCYVNFEIMQTMEPNCKPIYN